MVIVFLDDDDRAQAPPQTPVELQGRRADAAIPQSPGRTHVVKASTGYAFRVKHGSRFRIVDLYGEQVVDMMAWVTEQDDYTRRPGLCTGTGLPLEKLSMAYTRFHSGGKTPSIGEQLYTNKDRPLLKLVQDTCKVHDMTYMSCNPSFYADLGKPDHPSCSHNIFTAMEAFGATDELEIRGTDPFNVFQNTPDYSLDKPPGSKKGDFVEFEASADCIIGVSCCPYHENGFNGGVVTDVGIIVNS